MLKFPRFLAIFITSFLLPTLVVHPHADAYITQENEPTLRALPNIADMTYDDVMELIEDVESGEFENKYRPEDFDKMIQLIVTFARQGILPNEIEEGIALENDIQELLYGDSEEYSMVPAIFYGKGDIVLCKNWVSKKAHQTGKFIKKKKKAIIIGAVVVVAVVTIWGIAAGASAAAAATGNVASSGNNSPSRENSNASFLPPPVHESPIVKADMENQVFSFKENVASEHFFQPSSYEKPSYKEDGRVLGSLFAHDSFKNMNEPFSSQPTHSSSFNFGHQRIDKQFSTDYAPLYSGSSKETDFNTLAYQFKGEKELTSGHLAQAVYDFDRAIELNPSNPIPYLERGVAHFGLGQYDRSLDDYHQYTTKADKTQPLSVPAFSLGFAKGLPKGICESGVGLGLFISDVMRHPIRTGEQVWESLNLLGDLAKSGEWNTLSEVLAPEVHQLVKEWNTLPSEIRGELAGHAFGKYGADIIIPGAVAKAVAKGMKGAQEIGRIYKSLQTAEKTLLLETASELGSGARVGEALHTTYNTARVGEELGLSISEMTQLKQAGSLERTIEHIAHNPTLRESAEKFTNAKKALKPHANKPITEARARELIHEMGIPTFPRPEGIPEHFLVNISDKGAGMEYVHPINKHIFVRVMPGQPHSQFPCQQQTYVVQMKDGKAINKLGNRISPESPEAHIPLEEFLYKE